MCCFVTKRFLSFGVDLMECEIGGKKTFISGKICTSLTLAAVDPVPI